MFAASNRDIIENSYHTTGTESFILIASMFQIFGRKNLWGPFDPSPDLGRSRFKNSHAEENGT